MSCLAAHPKKPAVSVCIMKYAAWIVDDRGVVAQASVLCGVFLVSDSMIAGGHRTLSCKKMALWDANLLHDLWWEMICSSCIGRMGHATCWMD